MSRARKWALGSLLAAAMAHPASAAGVRPEAVPSPEAAEPVDGDTIPPLVILQSQVPPVYPPAALDARFEGIVKVKVDVHENGAVKNIEVVDCTHKNLGFEQAALDAVRQWRFEPARRAEQPVAGHAFYRLQFRVQSVGGVASPLVSAGSIPPQHAEAQQDSARPPNSLPPPLTAPRPTTGSRR